MGTYTTIIHPDDGRELQIKCGFDECLTYRVGDDVGQYIFPDHPGKGYLLDDVYISYSSLNVYGEDGEDDLVVIKGGRVVAVESLEATRDEIRAKRPSFPDADWAEVYEEEPNYVNPYDCRLYLRQEWDISDPPRSLWSEEAWEEEERARSNRQLATALAGPLRRNLDYTSITRRAFLVEPVPSGALPVFSEDIDSAQDVSPPREASSLTEEQSQQIIRMALEEIVSRSSLASAMSEHIHDRLEEGPTIERDENDTEDSENNHQPGGCTP